MHVFVTGATGWVGSAVVAELRAAGHRITGLARSERSAAVLDAAGVRVQRGAIEDRDALLAGAAAADAVIHTAFNHDFSRFAENGAAEREAIAALGAAVAGTGKPLIVTSGIGFVTGTETITENDARDPASPIPRDPESVAAAAAAAGARVAVVRLPPSVHGRGESHGFIPILIRIARERGVAAYPGDGTNRWSAVHVSDAARVYRLALESGANDPIYHAVGERGIATREIAAALGRRLDLPVAATTGSEIARHFGWFTHFAQLDVPASSALTQERLGWHPAGPTLLEDIDGGAYAAL